MPDEDSHRSHDRLLLLLIVAAVARVAVALYSLSAGQPLNWDEIEFFRASDFVRHGLLPYRDFWEHHAPLQWFLFAPVTALTSSPGVVAVIAMRWAQLPLWVATIALLHRWMRDAAIERWARLAATVLLLLDGPFIFQAIEFRIDALSTFLLIAALLLALRADDSAWRALSCGALLALSGFANLRVMPLALAVGALLLLCDPARSRWRLGARRSLIAAGGAVVCVGFIAFFFATSSAPAAWRYAVMDNIIAERFAAVAGGRSLQILANVAGLNFGQPAIPYRSPFIDVAALALWVAGAIGGMLLLRRWRHPDWPFVFAVIAVVNFLLTVREKLAYHYHFGLAAVMLVPLAAHALSRWPAGVMRRAVAAAVVIALILGCSTALLFSADRDLRFQDFMMREADRRTTRSDVVLDTVGWAIRRDSAYRYWFVPSLVRIMVATGRMQPYRIADALKRPPAIVLANERTGYWWSEDKRLGEFMIAHYAPVWQNLWIPAPNGVVGVGRSMEWIVLRDGAYRIYSSPILATHPWFQQPLASIRIHADELMIDLPRFGNASAAFLDWRVDGQPVTGDLLTLRKGQRLRVASHAGQPIGVFVIDPSERMLFRPTGGADLDGESPLRFHLPNG